MDGSYGAAPAHNFWLWGTWGKRLIKAPFLTQKVPGRMREVIIGNNFIIALKENGDLVSWGEDKVGCLGLGAESTNVQEPRRISFPADFKGKIIDVQYGKHHVLALTSQGKVYAWGDNAAGQLGVSDTQNRHEPVLIEELRQYTVTQILAVNSMSYALTSGGTVYAWGDNKDGCLALEHDKASVPKPEPMMRMKETKVKQLAVKDCGGTAGRGKTIVAFVELADPLPDKDKIGGFDKPLGGGAAEKVTLDDNTERDIFEGVDLMRRVMDNTQDWWERLLKVRHGSPYNDNLLTSSEGDPSEDNCTAMQLDTYVGLDILERASYELDILIQLAKDQLHEIRAKSGTKNVKFMLCLFMDDCMLRREKIRRTIAARQLMEHKQGISSKGNPDLLTAQGGAADPGQELARVTDQLSIALQRVRNLRTYDIFTRVLQDSLGELLEARLQVAALQMEVLRGKAGYTADPVLPGLKVIKERWQELKRFSIYNLYEKITQKGESIFFSSDDEMLAFLVERANQKLEQIVEVDRDQLVSRDTLIPGLCYEILLENAELRKMCNVYQLKVLMLKDKPSSAQFQG